MDLVYDSNADWQRFTGVSRIFNGAIKVAYTNAAEALGLSNLKYNYRFGQTQGFASDVGVGNVATKVTTGTGDVVFAEDGVTSVADGHYPSGQDVGAIAVGGTASDSTAVNDDPAASPQVPAAVWSCFVRFSQISFNGEFPYGTLFGWNLHHYGMDDGYGDGLSHGDKGGTAFSIYAARNYDYKMSLYAAYTRYEYDDNYWTVVQGGTVYSNGGGGIVLPDWCMDGCYHHLAAHTFGYLDGSNPKLKVRIFIDGRFLGDFDSNGGADTTPVVVSPSPSSNRPFILALADGHIDYAGGTPYSWASPIPKAPSPHAIDEFALAHDDVGLDVNSHRQVIAPWNPGDQVLPNLKRHPDPRDIGYANATFEIVGPVEDLGASANTAINAVRAVLVPADDVPHFDFMADLTKVHSSDNFSAGIDYSAWARDYDWDLAQRVIDDTGYLVYRATDDITSVRITTWWQAPANISPLRIYASPNGTSWTACDVTGSTPVHAVQTTYWEKVVISATMPAGSRYIKIEIAGSTGDAQNPTIADLVHYTRSFSVFNGKAQIAVRASPSSFTPDNGALPWSEWRTLDDGTSIATGGGGQGRYVQAKVRIYPDSSPKCLTSAGIDRLELFTATGAVLQDAHADLPWRLWVNPNADFPWRIKVRQKGQSDCPWRIGVVYPSQNDFPWSMFVRPRSDFPWRIHVRDYANLPWSYTVDDQNRHADLRWRFNMIRYDADLPWRFNVRERDIQSWRFFVPVHPFAWRMVVHQNGHRDLPWRLVVPHESPSRVGNLAGDVSQRIWQTRQTVDLTWDASTYGTSPVVGYYFAVRSASATPSTSWSHTTNTHVTVTLPGTGKWVICVAALNDLGYFGQVAAWEVWFNNLPTVPGSTFMTLNGADTLVSQPFVSRFPALGHTFAWTPATDPDNGDVLTYQFQIATAPDFPSGNIVVDLQNIATASKNWASPTESGVHYWRIRAFDGKQSSDWSAIGTFVVNIPPDRPNGLSAHQR